MQLLLNGTSLSIAQLGPNFLILGEPVEHPPAEGEISLRIDASESRWAVRLPDGISRGQKNTRIESR